MRKFNLYLNIRKNLISIGSSNNDYLKEFSTYNEQLEEKEHDQYILTFSVIAKTRTEDTVRWNPLLPYYRIGEKLHLIIDGYRKIDLIITQAAPITNSHNSEWKITAQDEVSYLWSKHNITQIYSTMDNGVLTPKNIFVIAEELLQSNWLTDWKISPYSRDAQLNQKYITLDNVQNNPYQIIIEACNTVGAYLSVDYSLKIIDFYRKDIAKFSGYRYHPKRNLNDYSASYSGEEMVTWLHVHGGEDANGIAVSMIPALPAPVRQYIQEQIPIIEAEVTNSDPNKSFLETWVESDNAPTLNAIYEYIGINTDLSFKSGYLEDFTDKFCDYTYAPITKIVFTTNGEDYEYTSATADLNLFGTNGSTPYVEFVLNNFAGDVADKYNKPYNIRIDDITDLNSIFPTVTISSSKTNISQQPIQVTITRDISNFTNEFQKKLKADLIQFYQITKEVPYLGQYLIDFTPFKYSMTTDDWTELHDDLLNKKLFRYNLLLQYYSEQYYSALIQVIESRNYLEKTLGDLYLGACEVYRKATEDAKTQALEDIKKYKQEIQNYIKQSEYKATLQKMGKSDALEINENGTQYWKNLIYKQSEYIQQYQAQQASLPRTEEDNINTETSAYKYYENLIQRASDLISYNNIIDSADAEVIGLYPFILRCLSVEISNGIAKQYEGVQTAITNNVFKTLYTKYGQYLYESTYENAEELDSISLYNQAITYFTDLNRIQSSHSLTVLDIGSLDAIFIPRLSVGSVISVFNPDNPSMLPYSYYLEQLEIAEQNLQKNPKTRDSYNIAKDKLINYYKELNGLTEEDAVFLEQIKEELYQDKILVTGITRVLREPLRDSVTVEQSSRYKSILAKLIKSI